MNDLTLDTLKNRLDEIQARYDTWYAFLAQQRRMLSSSSPDYEEKLAALEQERLKVYNPYEESAQVFDELCPFYWTATAEQRAAIRTMFKEREFWYYVAPFRYLNIIYTRLEQNPDVGTLRLGLAAISIEDCSSDYRDTSIAIHRLAQAARLAGIDPAPHFLAMAELSSDQISKGGMSSMKEMLTQFRRSR